MYIRGQNGLTDTFNQSLQGKPGVSLITNGTRILLNKGDTKTYTILPQAKTNDEIENFKSVIIWSSPLKTTSPINDKYDPTKGPHAGNLIAEFSITESNIYYDLSAVDGIDNGLSFTYQPENSSNVTTTCKPTNLPQGLYKNYLDKSFYGYNAIMSDKWRLTTDIPTKQVFVHRVLL